MKTFFVASYLKSGRELKQLRECLKSKEASGATIIAVDGGLKFCERLKIVPDLAVGDWDSYGKKPKSGLAKKFVHLERSKDQSDLAVAFEWAAKMQTAGAWVVFGASGGRMDHELAAWSEAFKWAHSSVRFMGLNRTVWVLKSGPTRRLAKFYLPIEQGTPFSIIEFGATFGVSRVTLEGAVYPLKKARLISGSHGLSNCVTSDLLVQVHSGAYLVIAGENSYE